MTATFKKKLYIEELVAVLPLLLLIWFIFRNYEVLPQGDTVALLSGLDSAIDCLRNGTLPCGPQVIHFPIFQYLIGLPFKLLGFSNEGILKVYGYLNFVSFVVAACIFYFVGRGVNQRFGGVVAVLIFLSGYTTWYAVVTFNEATAFMLFALLAYGVLKAWPIFSLSIVAYLVTITKEVAAPFVIYTLFLSYLSCSECRFSNLRDLLTASKIFIFRFIVPIIFTFIGIATNILFNFFRFGDYRNTSNLDPTLHTPVDFVPTFFFSLLFSPAGGLALVWLSFLALISLPFVVPRFFSNRALCLYGLIWLGLLAMNFGLSFWYSPFGWIAWGPRLTLPLLGSLFVLAVFNYKNLTVPKFSHGVLFALFFTVCIILLTSLMPNYFVVTDAGSYFSKMFAPTSVQLNSDVELFIVQTVPSEVYMRASVESYFRNVIAAVSLSNVGRFSSETIVLALLVVLSLAVPFAKQIFRKEDRL